MKDKKLDKLAEGPHGIFKSTTSPREDEKEKTLWNRYSEMTSKWNSLGIEIKKAHKIVKKPNNFINKITSKIRNDYNEIPLKFSSMEKKIKGLTNTKDRLATDEQRFNDEMLKQKSQYMKNGAFGVLAISFFIFAITKIKKI